MNICLQQGPNILRDIMREEPDSISLHCGLELTGQDTVCSNNLWILFKQFWHRTQCCCSWTSKGWH